MRRTFQKVKRAVSQISWRDKSGQALIEFTLVTVVLLVLIFGAIDFCRAIYLRQMLVNLSRETANLEARGTGSTTAEIMSNALSAAIQEAQPLGLDSVTGMVIVTSVTSVGDGTNGIINHQFMAGTLPCPGSLIGTVGNRGNLPTASILPANRTVYVAEIYYQFIPITPVGNFIKTSLLPAQFYDVAYFSSL